MTNARICSRAISPSKRFPLRQFFDAIASKIVPVGRQNHGSQNHETICSPLFACFAYFAVRNWKLVAPFIASLLIGSFGAAGFGLAS
jgi:hypothetical protein